MTDPTRICLVGATGLIGGLTLVRAKARQDVAVIGVARRQVPGAETLVADTPQWRGLISSARAEVLACALGTTRAKAGSAEAFQAIDRDLVLGSARAARAAGISRMVVVSSVGADPGGCNLYLRTKGDMEEGLAALGFDRLDILRPAQLIGARAESRPLERAAQVAMRGVDLLLRGPLRRFHSIAAQDVADAILALAKRTAPGRFVHEHDAIVAAARSGSSPARGGGSAQR